MLPRAGGRQNRYIHACYDECMQVLLNISFFPCLMNDDIVFRIAFNLNAFDGGSNFITKSIPLRGGGID